MSELKIKYFIRTDKVGSDCGDIVEIDKDYWESLNEKEKEDEMKEHAFNHMEWGFWRLEE